MYSVVLVIIVITLHITNICKRIINKLVCNEKESLCKFQCRLYISISDRKPEANDVSCTVIIYLEIAPWYKEVNK